MRTIRVIVILSVCLLVCSCLPDNDDIVLDDIQSGEKSDTIPVVVVPAGLELVSASFSHLAYGSDIVVIATVEKSLDYVNLARLSDDYSKPHPNLYHVGENYRIRVEEYLKGKGDEFIYVSHRRGMLSGELDGVGQADIKAALGDSQGMIPLRLGKRYLMFLARLPHDVEGYPRGTLCVGVEPPWLFDASDPSAVVVDSEYAKSLESEFSQFSPTPLDKVVEEINTPFVRPTFSVKPTATVQPVDPYPGPADIEPIDGDENSKSGPTPYP